MRGKVIGVIGTAEEITTMQIDLAMHAATPLHASARMEWGEFLHYYRVLVRRVSYAS